MSTPDTVEVVAAGFSPLKGTRHLTYDTVELDAHGPVGDRAYCLVDVARAVVLRTVQHPRLMGVVAQLDGPVLTLRVPDGPAVAAVPEPSGQTLTCDYWGRQVPLELQDGPHAAAFSAYLGKDVRLAAAPRGAVVFGDPVSVVTTASLADLAERSGRAQVVDEAGRFRSTLVVDAGPEPFAEEAWTGRLLRAGDAVLRIGVPIPRCAVIDHHPATGEKDVRLLKTLASYRPLNAAGEPCFGVYAGVVTAGTVSVR